MNVDTHEFRAVQAENAQLRAEVGEVRSHLITIAAAVTTFGEHVTGRWAPVPARPGQARHARPDLEIRHGVADFQARHARPRGHLRLIQDGKR